MDDWNGWAALTGICIGLVVYGAAADVSRWFEARKTKREAETTRGKLEQISAAMEREMAAVLDVAVEAARRAADGEPTPGCDCPPCVAKRMIAQKGMN